MYLLPSMLPQRTRKEITLEVTVFLTKLVTLAMIEILHYSSRNVPVCGMEVA